MRVSMIGVVTATGGLANAALSPNFNRWAPYPYQSALPAVQAQLTATATSDVAAAAATAKTESPVSNIRGKAFDRFMTIFLEVNGYDDVISERAFKPTIAFCLSFSSCRVHIAYSVTTH
jgi:hypothetical protein